MSSEKIFLNVEEQVYLMHMMETDNPTDAVEKFALLMIAERANPTDLLKYLKKIMKKNLK